jgi:aryl-alcohol dehydrogenase-like predicted oxidoreductase
MTENSLTRAEFLKLAGGAALALASGVNLPAHASGGKMLTRPIPSSGEKLPIIGCGTSRAFDVSIGSSDYQKLPAVLEALYAAGGSVIDTSPMYGKAEAVTGELFKATASRGKAFVATKVWTSGREDGISQMQKSMQLLQTDKIDLMQVHNLLDWRVHLATLRDWKAKGIVRYLGVTHYTVSAYCELEAVMKAEQLDFIQVNYSLDEREAEARILPLATERGIAVLINRPFGGGSLLRKLRNNPLPAWAPEIGVASWAQILLKFVLSHPAVTCAIPGTGKAEHMIDNAQAGMSATPDGAFWNKHAKDIDL